MAAGDHGICLGDATPSAERGQEAQRIIFSVVYNADEKSSLIPVLISRLEYRRSEKIVFGRTEASSCIRTENIIIYPPTFVTDSNAFKIQRSRKLSEILSDGLEKEPGVTCGKEQEDSGRR